MTNEARKFQPISSLFFGPTKLKPFRSVENQTAVATMKVVESWVPVRILRKFKRSLRQRKDAKIA